jgi:hypothetical protein
MKSLGNLKSLLAHIVGFLLIPGLKAGRQDVSRVEAGILLALGTVHARVVRYNDNQAAVDVK